MKAVVWTGELEVRDDVEVRDLRPNEVRVRTHAAGLCHSDVSVVNGTIPNDGVALVALGNSNIHNIKTVTKAQVVADQRIVQLLGHVFTDFLFRLYYPVYTEFAQYAVMDFC